MASVAERIVEVLESHVRPIIESHGGGIEFVSYDEGSGVLKVQLHGACGGCPGAAATLQGLVEGVVRRYVPEMKEVVQA
ncbi:MAG: NifU family protein [Synergistaceae bacterium]|jgi:Fe-S cluster biogenesis protein NfuA|nr:NifU family protein [Synergistaceae bacterium]